ncbi:MAG TPA: CsgG/HfaB family protein [Spirochaetota bacterium]|nr:CsgG/HfaB family protein [Spirochaetota bacterium]HPL18064.1 CsgG/HfaB family protein [Spirochaetota bacterium]HQF08260.1 CsgG/HfaB family protein [Spirochaetota bacterium]HQH97125.1 CsgG/HfaB family protein [Spirochaetota bacterium]HQJ70035.1 CsgG/HfaB family protein [Spirochaetota bacterium]
MKQSGKRFIGTTFIAATALAVISCSTSKISLNRAEMDKVTTVAIMRFDSSPGIQDVVVTECEEAFRGHFIDAGKNVVERSKLKSILKEVERSQSGMVSSSEEIGRLSGAQALLFGTITRNEEEVKWVEYIEYVKNPATKETEKIKKSKRKKFFRFQIQARLVSTSSGATIMTIKNEYPERSYEITDSMTLNRFRENILEQMGKDLKKYLEERK